MKRLVMIGCGVTLALTLSACQNASYGVSVGYPYYDPWDYGFRYGVYDHHHDVDVDVNLPDRPRPPPGYQPGRPGGPGAGAGRPNIDPGFSRPSRPSGGRGPRRMR